MLPYESRKHPANRVLPRNGTHFNSKSFFVNTFELWWSL